MEKREKVKMIRVDMLCDVCGDGHMRPTMTSLTSNPPKYEHQCDNCLATAVYDRIYPYLEPHDKKK